LAKRIQQMLGPLDLGQNPASTSTMTDWSDLWWSTMVKGATERSEGPGDSSIIPVHEGANAWSFWGLWYFEMSSRKEWDSQDKTRSVRRVFGDMSQWLGIETKNIHPSRDLGLVLCWT
jgi:hypothetical protein